MSKEFSYTTRKGHTIKLSLYGEHILGEAPCILYLHGFKGFKDWGFVPYAGRYFAQAGFSFLCFNFSHNGIGAQPDVFTEFDKFQHNTYSLEMEESLEIIHLVSRTNFLGRDLNHPLGLLGHSRGGGIALLAAQQAAEVSAVATWAAVSTIDRVSKKDREVWRKQGFREVVNSRTGQVFRMGMDMLEDIEKYSKTRLHILDASRQLNKPLLLLHGEADESVPYFEAEQINIYADPGNTQFRLIPHAGHTFGARHPFEASTPQLDLVLELTRDFFRHTLQ